MSALSTWPLHLSRDVSERLPGSRDPRKAAAFLLALLAQRQFDHVIIADDFLFSALLAPEHRSALGAWFPIDAHDADAVDVLVSKHGFARRAPSLGLLIPDSVLAASADAAAQHAREFGYPVVLKGERGFAGAEIRIVDGEAALRRESAPFLARYGRVLVQRRIDGQRAGVAVVYARGLALGYKAYLERCPYPTAMSASTVHAAFTHPSIASVVETLGAATGFHGLAVIDFMYEPSSNRLYAIEMNPRPTLAFGGTLHNRQFFAPLLSRMLRGETGARVTAEVPAAADAEEVYAPPFLFYYLKRADRRDPLERRRLAKSLAELRHADPLITAFVAAWETGRFALRGIKGRPNPVLEPSSADSHG